MIIMHASHLPGAHCTSSHTSCVSFWPACSHCCMHGSLQQFQWQHYYNCY
uniref:Uncharacterized protein n=1 Tax=Arundo donax TaxID=35708 RepID=A0A0A9FEI0_ARUDO